MIQWKLEEEEEENKTQSTKSMSYHPFKNTSDISLYITWYFERL